MTTQSLAAVTLPPQTGAAPDRGHPGGDAPDHESLAAVRATITAYAPRRLPELERERDQAFAQALGSGSLRPVHRFLHRWQAVASTERELADITRAVREEFLHHPATGHRPTAARAAAALEFAAILLTAAAEPPGTD
ncbi:DUF6247 family protein [Kitasatospora camelliae]|uniref:DUF6247 family protein n=1 Tax=Kitasatospora camelliae TaxID=3156397 RepID=A0AAU8K2N9_9ACTN